MGRDSKGYDWFHLVWLNRFGRPILQSTKGNYGLSLFIYTGLLSYLKGRATDRDRVTERNSICCLLLK